MSPGSDKALYPIVGQDTDGTVTPQDAGMDWIVSKATDFVGKRSYNRTDTVRIGQTLLAPVGDDLLPVEVNSSVLYEPEGTKRDG